MPGADGDPAPPRPAPNPWAGPNDGYKILPPPPGYAPIHTPARKLMATPTPFGATPLYQIPEEDRCALCCARCTCCAC